MLTGEVTNTLDEEIGTRIVLPGKDDFLLIETKLGPQFPTNTKMKKGKIGTKII